MPQTQTNTDPFAGFTQEEKEMSLFVETLVRATIGYSLLEIPEDKQAQAIEGCTKLFVDFVEKYVEAKYGKKDTLRLKASQQFAGQDMFKRFADLGGKFDEAYDAYFDSVAA